MSKINDWVSLPISFGIGKEGNLSPFASDEAYFGQDGLIPNRSTIYLGWTKVSSVWGWHIEGSPHVNFCATIYGEN